MSRWRTGRRTRTCRRPRREPLRGLFAFSGGCGQGRGRTGDLPLFSIQIMPALAPPHPGMSGPFTLLEFRQRDLDLVLLSDMLASNWVEKPEHVDLYRAAFDEIMATALSLGESLNIIREKRDQLK
ncbi:Scr1 family TA system antitoxin-like transcriptional regulator [Kitasatospora sp. NPDC089913]|uniref:Scr1 family TA system antitoxin-like transcriptional regulator n=1 Tax=Kitasatospora sp. NPDC089913 TaxID=3364080 RepID=UPI00380899F2